MEPQAPSIASMSPTRRRYRRSILLILVVFLLIAVVTAGAVVARYDPLERGASAGTPNISVPFHDEDNSSGRQTRIITYVQGASLSVDFSVRNKGRWTVTIVDVPGKIGAEYPYGLFDVTKIGRGVLGRCCADTEPFAPFELRPDEERIIRLTGVMKGCGRFESGSSVGLDSLDIRYRFLKFTRTGTIGTGLPIEIHIPDGYVCPESQPPSRR